MKRFIQGEHRGQSTLLPESLDDYVSMPDVAILDIGMPNMDGHQAARAIRALPGGDEVFLIALSGWGSPEDVDKSKNAGFNRHLTKPADLETLLAMVATAEAPDSPGSY